MDLSSGRRRYLVWFFRTNILPTLGKVVGIATRWFSPKKGVDPAASIDGGVRVHRSLLVNGARVDLEMAPDATLVDILRGPLGLKGTKEACGRGECGACTVSIDDIPVLACLTLAARTQGAIRTIEDFTEECADLRAAFADHGGFQCGFCTAGQIVHAASLLKEGVPEGSLPGRAIYPTPHVGEYLPVHGI